MGLGGNYNTYIHSFHSLVVFSHSPFIGSFACSDKHDILTFSTYIRTNHSRSVNHYLYIHLHCVHDIYHSFGSLSLAFPHIHLHHCVLSVCIITSSHLLRTSLVPQTFTFNSSPLRTLVISQVSDYCWSIIVVLFLFLFLLHPSLIKTLMGCFDQFFFVLISYTARGTMRFAHFCKFCNIYIRLFMTSIYNLPFFTMTTKLWYKSPADFYADGCTDMSMNAKRQNKRRSHPPEYYIGPTDHSIGIGSNLEFPLHWT